MDYSGMTVAQLKGLLDERGIGYPSKPKKAELIEILERGDEPIEVEAETFDGAIAPAGVLSIDVADLQRAVMELNGAIDRAATALGEYDVEDDALDAMGVRDVRTCEDGIAAAKKDVDERRLAVGRMLDAPRKLVNEKCKEVMEPLDALAAKYAGVREAKYREGFEAQYQECCIKYGIERLLDVKPFDEFFAMHPTWKKRNANPLKVQESIASEVERVVADWQRLRARLGSMRFPDVAEREFFASLDVSRAIAAEERAVAEQERIDAMNREREENERWRRELAMQADADEIESFNRAIVEQQLNAYAPAFEAVEPEQEQPAGTARNAYADEQAHMRELVAEHVADGHPNRRRYHFEAWLDDAELQSFREWKNACGIGDGWTFREVRNG